MNDPNIINELRMLHAHAAETQRMAEAILNKLEKPAKKRKSKSGLSDEFVAKVLANRMKTIYKNQRLYGNPH